MKVIGARYGTVENSLDSGVIIATDTLGNIATSTQDAPYSGGAWEALQIWIGQGNTVAAYVPPEE